MKFGEAILCNVWMSNINFCHLFQHEGEPCKHKGGHKWKTAHGKHPGETLFPFRKDSGQHATSALQTYHTVTKTIFVPLIQLYIYIWTVQGSKSLHALDYVSKQKPIRTLCRVNIDQSPFWNKTCLDEDVAVVLHFPMCTCNVWRVHACTESLP